MAIGLSWTKYLIRLQTGSWWSKGTIFRNSGVDMIYGSWIKAASFTLSIVVCGGVSNWLYAGSSPLAEVTSQFNGNVLITQSNHLIHLVTMSDAGTVMQSTLDTTNPTRLVDRYTQVMSLATALHPSPNSVLNIGLGGAVLPRFHVSRYPQAVVTSYEIDPVIVQLANQYFPVPAQRHTVLTGDGSALLAVSTSKFDVIWVDVWSGTEGIPAVFKESVFIANMNSHLNANGVVMFNLWDPDPLNFTAIIDLYRSEFSKGILVRLPFTLNSILITGYLTNITCADMSQLYTQWEQAGLVNFHWQEWTFTMSGREKMCEDL